MEEDTFRRSGIHDEMSEAEGVDYAPSEDLEEESVSQRMASKIRDQAVRLNQLEAENQILKQRTKEPIPVGEPRTPSRDHPSPIATARIEGMQNEIEDLQKSINAEILNSEEQRAYIEILRTALEAKMEDLGFMHKNIDAYSQITQVKVDSDAYQREASRLQSIASDQEFQIKKSQQKLVDMKQGHDDAITNQAQMESDLNESVNALQMAQNEIDKLSDEKVALLDSIDEGDANIKAFESELSQLNAQLTGAAQQKQDADSKIQMHETKIKALQADIQRLIDEGHEKDSEIEAEKQTLYELHSNLTLKEHQLVDTQATLDRERDLWQRQKEHYAQEIDTIRGVNDNQQKSLDETSRNLQASKSNEAASQAQIQDLNSQVSLLQNRNDSIQANLNAVKDTLHETNNEKETVRSERDKIRGELTTVTSLSESVKARLNDSEDKGLKLNSQIQTMTEKLIRKKTRLRDTTGAKESLNTELNLQTDEANRLKDLLTKTEDNLYRETAKIQSLESKLRSLTNENDEILAKNSALEGLNSEKNQNIDVLTRENSGLSQNLHQTRRELDDTIIQLDETKREADDVSSKFKLQQTDLMQTHSDVKNLETKLASSHYTESLIDEENNQLKYHIEELQRELASSMDRSTNFERELRERDVDLANSRQNVDELKAALNSTEMDFRRASDELMNEKKMCDGEREAKMQAHGTLDRMQRDSKKISQILQMFGSNTMLQLHASSQQSSVVSGSMKNLLPELKNVQFDSGDLTMLVDWIGASCDELEALIRHASDLKVENDSTSKSLLDLQDTRFRENEERERVHNQKIETSNKLQQETSREVSLLKAKEMELQRDNEMLISKIQAFNDTQADELQIRLIEEREHKNMQSLLSRVQMLLPQALQRNTSEILRLRKDQSTAEREKIKIENELAFLENDFNSTGNRRELDNYRDKLSTVKRDLQMYTRQIVSLEDDLIKIDANERRKQAVSDQFALASKEDQLKNQSMELEKTRYEKQEVENAFQNLLNEKYSLEATLTGAGSALTSGSPQRNTGAASALRAGSPVRMTGTASAIRTGSPNRSPLRRRVPSIPKRFVSSGSKGTLGQSIEARLSQNRFAEDLMRSSDRQRCDYPKQEDI